MSGRQSAKTPPEERRAIGLRIADEHRQIARRMLATADRIERRAKGSADGEAGTR